MLTIDCSSIWEILDLVQENTLGTCWKWAWHERRGVIKVWNARFQRIIDSVGSCQGRNETNWAGPRQVNQPNACALEQTLMHGQRNVCIYVHSSHRHSHDAQKSSCCRWTLIPLPTSASASGRCAIITCRDGALTRATSKNDDEFARRMPPATNGHGKNQWSCGLSPVPANCICCYCSWVWKG